MNANESGLHSYVMYKPVVTKVIVTSELSDLQELQDTFVNIVCLDQPLLQNRKIYSLTTLFCTPVNDLLKEAAT